MSARLAASPLKILHILTLICNYMHFLLVVRSVRCVLFVIIVGVFFNGNIILAFHLDEHIWFLLMTFQYPYKKSWKTYVSFLRRRDSYYSSLTLVAILSNHFLGERNWQFWHSYLMPLLFCWLQTSENEILFQMEAYFKIIVDTNILFRYHRYP